jgi:CheY-like chemotaxis protein
MEKQKPKILLVDDDDRFTKVTQLALTDYHVLVENNPAFALEQARSFRPDLILLDVMMPTLDGGDVAAQIKAEPALKKVPIVFLTALVTKKESARWPSLGGYPFLSKPVTPEVLTETIEKYLVG